MTTASRLHEVEEIDLFLAAPKTLTELLPDWGDSPLPGRWAASWPIIEEGGFARESTRLVFTCKKDDPRRVSIRLLFRNTQVAGIDLVPGNECKMNLPNAAALGLPPRVSGSHFHSWPDNRDYALAAGPGQLPYRRPTPRLLVRLPHALTALAQSVNLTLTPQQASFDVPSQGSLV